VVVYQAYRPAIGRFASQNQRFGGEFSLNRMSWIKPNFLWMMHRSGWGTKEGQEITLAVHLQRAAFDLILDQAVHSSYVPEAYASKADWTARLAKAPVRLQWDPDHDPRGERQERRAVQLGLAGEVLRQYAQNWIVGNEDISAFVAEQRANVESNCFANLVTPREEVYPVATQKTATHIGTSPN
jgi:hypothetical protein